MKKKIIKKDWKGTEESEVRSLLCSFLFLLRQSKSFTQFTLLFLLLRFSDCRLTHKANIKYSISENLALE